MADDIVVGSVAVDIVPDTRKFKPDLEAKLQGISIDIGVNADTTGVRAQIDEIAQGREATINVNADTGAAEAQIDGVARPRTATVNTKVSGTSDLFKAVSGFSGLATAALALTPALVPVLATVGAIGLALGAPLAIAAGGATVFGFITGFAIKQTEEQKKKIDQLAKSVATAKQSLANTQASASRSAANSLATARASAAASLKSAQQALANAKTAAQRHAAQQRIDAAEASLSARRAAISRSQSASVATAQAKVTQAVAAYQAALKGLTPAQAKFLAAQTALKTAFQGLIETSGPEILGPVTKGLRVLTGIMPALTPLIGAASDALTTLLDGIGNAARGPGFQSFISAFSKQVTPDIVAFGRIAGNVLKGVTGLVLVLGKKFGGDILNNLVTLTDKFAGFGQVAGKSQALQGFFDYFHRVGPSVGQTLGAVARAVGHIVEALAPLGPPVLHIVTDIADEISGIPIPVLTALTATFLAMATAAKIGKGLSALGLLTGGGGLGGGKGGALSSFVATAKPVPVFVTNPGFGGPGGKGPGVVPVNPKGGTPGAVAEAEAEAARAAKAAAAAVKAAGGDAAAQSSAAGRAFKEALAAHDAAVLKAALDFGIKGGLRGLLGTVLAPPAALSLSKDTGQAVEPNYDVNNVGNLKDFLKATGQLGGPLKSTATQVDALRASLDKASTGFDLVGHSAHRNFGSVTADAAALRAELAKIQDKKFKVLLDDLAAVQSLKALQAFRLKDKTLTVNEQERVVGPGGGIGHPLAPVTPDVPQHHPSTRSGSGGSAGPLVEISGPVQVADVNDLLRKTGNAFIARAGGGVMLRPPPTARFS